MKKTYMTPSAKVVMIDTQSLLAGSPTVNGPSDETPEEYGAKKFSIFDLGEDYEEE